MERAGAKHVAVRRRDVLLTNLLQFNATLANPVTQVSGLGAVSAGVVALNWAAQNPESTSASAIATSYSSTSVNLVTSTGGYISSVAADSLISI